MARLIEDVLMTWREAEGTLDALPPDHPERDRFERTVADLRDAYQQLSAGREQPAEYAERTRIAVEAARRMVDHTLKALREAEAHLGPHGRQPGDPSASF